MEHQLENFVGNLPTNPNPNGPPMRLVAINEPVILQRYFWASNHLPLQNLQYSGYAILARQSEEATSSSENSIVEDEPVEKTKKKFSENISEDAKNDATAPECIEIGSDSDEKVLSSVPQSNNLKKRSYISIVRSYSDESTSEAEFEESISDEESEESLNESETEEEEDDEDEKLVVTKKAKITPPETSEPESKHFLSFSSYKWIQTKSPGVFNCIQSGENNIVSGTLMFEKCATRDNIKCLDYSLQCWIVSGKFFVRIGKEKRFLNSGDYFKVLLGEEYSVINVDFLEKGMINYQVIYPK